MGSDSGKGRAYDLKDYMGNSGNGLFADAFSDRPEQTVGGAAIGVTRDLFSRPDDYQERLKRAEENDMASLIAADTMAIIPKFRALPAGLTRATMLVNPHQGLQDNAGAFVRNVGEGVALNQVGKMMLPGSKLQGAFARNISSPFAREIATHLSVGAGFGAVKSSFDVNNWSDADGNFDPEKLVGNVAKGTVTGAALNLPAGLVGMRVMRGSMSLMAQTEVSRRVVTTVAAAGSGYTSGAVFGGIDGVMHGKSFSETLEQMHFAGKVGIATGAVVGALDKGALTSRYTALSENVAKTVPVRDMAAAFRKPGAETPKRAIAVAAEEVVLPRESKPAKNQRFRPSQEELVWDEAQVMQDRQAMYQKRRLDYQPRVDYRVAEIAPRLSKPRIETEMMLFPKPGAKKTFSSFEDFLGQTELKPVRMRVYDIKGHDAKLMVEEGLAVKQDQVRAERLALEYQARKDISFDSMPAETRHKISLEWHTAKNHEAMLAQYMNPAQVKEALPVLRARMQLLKPGGNARIALPEDFVVLLDEVPNRTKVNRIVLTEEPNAQDAWTKQKYNDPTFESAASAGDDGVITFYLTPRMSQSRPTLRMFMGHEWSHLAANATPEEAALQGLAARVDKDIPNPNYRPRATAGDAQAKAEQKLSDTSQQSKSKAGGANPDQKTDKYYSRDYARTNPGEDFAVHMGEEMLAPVSDNLVALGRNAPVRTVLLARSLTRVMSSARPENQGTHNKQIWERMGYVEKEVYPEAMKLLERRIRTGTAEEKAASAELLGHLGNRERHTPMLRKLAGDQASRVIPEGVENVTDGFVGAKTATGTGANGLSFNPGGKRTVAEIAFDAMLRLHHGDVNEQFVLLVNESRPGSLTRDIAQTRLGQARHEAAPAYLKFSNYVGNANRLPEMLDLMATMPGMHGKQLVFSEAHALGKNSPQFQRSLIARALELPGVAGKAIGLLKPEDVPSVERQLLRLSRQTWDRPAQEKARDLLEIIPAEMQLGRAYELLRSDNPRGVQQGVEIVIASKGADLRLLPELLKVAANAPEATSRSAMQALKRYNPQMVKFHAQALRREGHNTTPELVQRIVGGP